ncbi:MAG: hypothetical protein QOJ01_676 [Solirubrobacterales bacterium]|jgi:hypothetical protein|nr:hypothetical protein [Solirubrobacterales bacterium]
MRPERQDIAAPEFPPGTRWIGGAPEQMSAMTARGPVLVHFFDFAQLNSVRALPYAIEWARRYLPRGLVTLGVHAPRHPFTAAAGALSAALGRLGVEHPVADDSSYALWRDYGCEGWPALFLWGRGGALRWFHFGEGEYEATELAIQAELAGPRGAESFPAPMTPLRATDAPGAIVIAPTPEVLPGGSADVPWAPSGLEVLELDYAAGGVYAAVDGVGELTVAVDGGAPTAVDVVEPGLVELVAHEHHAEHALALGARAGVRVWAISFAPGIP